MIFVASAHFVLMNIPDQALLRS
ncbi:MAG: hypothetical protein QG660_33, partial [Pseudomonadota bacterium]|nr:hypothetical protein [Pseudomonadota bacterium]